MASIGLQEAGQPNVFGINTIEMKQALLALPAIESAAVDVVLPDRLVVQVTERMPVFVLRTIGGAFLVDADGFFLARPGDDPASASLPVVDDKRLAFAADAGVGGRLDEVSLSADLRLAAITTESVGSSFTDFHLTVDDTDGFVLTAEPNGWRAIFGHYTPTLRPIDIVDRQVECLRSRVEAGESDLAVIYLAPLEDRCGTYLPRSTPRATASPSPAR